MNPHSRQVQNVDESDVERGLDARSIRKDFVAKLEADDYWLTLFGSMTLSSRRVAIRAVLV